MAKCPSSKYQHLVSLKEEEVFELTFGELVTFVQLTLFHFPDCGLPRAHQLLLLL